MGHNQAWLITPERVTVTPKGLLWGGEGHLTPTPPTYKVGPKLHFSSLERQLKKLLISWMCPLWGDGGREGRRGAEPVLGVTKLAAQKNQTPW